MDINVENDPILEREINEKKSIERQSQSIDIKIEENDLQRRRYRKDPS